MILIILLIAILIILSVIGKKTGNTWLMAPLGSIIFGYVYLIIGGLIGYFAFDTFWGGVGIGYLIAIISFARNPEKMIKEHEESRESYHRTRERIREKERRRPQEPEGERYLEDESGRKIEGYFYDDDTYKSGGHTYRKDTDGNWYEE